MTIDKITIDKINAMSDDDRTAAKDLLKDYRAMRMELRHIRKQMGDAREDIILPSFGYDSGPRRGSYVRQHIAESIERVLDNEAARAMTVAKDVYRISSAVDQIADPELRLCLQLRYMIDNCNHVVMPAWPDIARVMYGKDDDYRMCRLKDTHRRALDAFAMNLKQNRE